jgi:hypothetical protein
MEATKIREKIVKHLKGAVNYLVEKGYDIKFKNINKIIDEVNEVFLKASSITKTSIIPLITLNIEMFVDEIHTFDGEVIFTTNSDVLDVNYFHMRKNDFDFEIEKQKDLVGTGKISFELIVEDSLKGKIQLLSQLIKENAKLIEDFEIFDDNKIYFEIPTKFKVVKYLI